MTTDYSKLAMDELVQELLAFEKVARGHGWSEEVNCAPWTFLEDALPQIPQIHPIRNDDDHAAALAEIECLWNSTPGTPNGDALEVLTVLVDDYERRKHPIAASCLGPPMAFLNCTLKQDYSDRLFRVASVGEDAEQAGGGFAQLISLDGTQEFLVVDTVTLLRDFAVVPGAMPAPAIMRLGDDT